MTTQLCFPGIIMDVRITLGTQLHFLLRCNSDGHYCSKKVQLFLFIMAEVGQRLVRCEEGHTERALEFWLGFCLSVSWSTGTCLHVFSVSVCAKAPPLPHSFPRLRNAFFIYEHVKFWGGALTLKWTCKQPIEKQMPAALITRTDKAILLCLFMTFCLC